LGKKESVKEMQENHNSQDIQDQGSEEEWNCSEKDMGP
jgi:hypothetical protein